MDVIFTTQEKFDGVTLWDPEANNRILRQLELSNFTVNLNVIYLDTPERYKIQYTPLDIVFEQHQRNVFLIEPGSKIGTFNLNFTNCVKEIYFIAKKFGHWSQEQITILNQLQDLDRLTPSQVTVLNILKQSIFRIPIWEEIIRVVASTLTGETDQTVRDSTVNVLLQSILWGEEQIILLETLKDPLSDPQAIAILLNQYLNTIPAQILTIQITVTGALNTLPGQTDANTRIAIIDPLIAIPNVWGVDQVQILETLKDPNLGAELESLLILQLRVFLTQISFFFNWSRYTFTRFYRTTQYDQWTHTISKCYTDPVRYLKIRYNCGVRNFTR